jgi:hypothetical protein
MMARSTTRSNQRPDTLMQDRICQIDETSCNARPDQSRRFCDVSFSVRYPQYRTLSRPIGPVCTAPSCARIAYDRRNRGSSGGLSSTG